jgi:hypothetical protein
VLPVSDQQVRGSIGRLDPVDRSLLDLSVRRGVEDEVIATILRVDEIEIARRRRQLLEAVADYLGLVGEEERARLPAILEALPDQHWAEPEEPRRQRRRWPLVAVAVALLAVAAGAVGALVASGGGGGRSPVPAFPRGARLSAVTPGGPGRGTATVRGRRLRVKVAGLPALEEAYEVWLYNDVTDAVPLGRHVGGAFTLTVTLPTGAGRYRFIDVSREPLDGNPNHSGASVLRVPLGRLLRPSSR